MGGGLFYNDNAYNFQKVLKDAVAAHGIPAKLYVDNGCKSTFLRRLILYGFVYDIDYSDLREYNYTLGKISSNLNQIAKRMNATGNVYKADVEEVKKLMKQVWDTQKSMLSKQPTMKQ